MTGKGRLASSPFTRADELIILSVCLLFFSPRILVLVSMPPDWPLFLLLLAICASADSPVPDEFFPRVPCGRGTLLHEVPSVEFFRKSSWQ